MIESQRHERIVELVNDLRHCSIHDLLAAIPVSEPTLRRDLRQLSAGGRIRRVRGGASACEVDGTFEPYRGCAHREAKRRIGRQAAALCQASDAIAIDAGSTTFQMVDFLAVRPLTVLTNSFPVAQALTPHADIRVVLCAGEVDPERGAILDPFAHSAFTGYACERLFMSAESCDSMGIYNDDRAVIRSEQDLLRVARELVLLIDSSKLRRPGTLRLCDWSAVGLCITDDGLDDESRAMLDRLGVRYTVA